DFLAARRPTAATELLANVSSLVRRLADAEFEGPSVQLRSGEFVRSWPISPFRLYYQLEDDSLRVLRIYHQSRRPITR
ncbi:MAG TPA: type II toxin-antitoxin system RelE/ParE family toxin, partial [Anaeromyxobacteraceae bacterium]|nr:type II toxin-antitoxin system RelE/ParE family toxin [Anaeromyxobacteraceae bacterium]